MGWLGWTEQQTLASDMQSIEAAYRGRHEMLEALSGKDIPHAKIDKVETAQMPMTPTLFAAIFGGNK